LRGDPRAATLVARVRDFTIPAGIEDTLRKNKFRVRIDETFKDFSPSKYITIRIFDGPKEDPNILYDPPYTDCNDDEARVAVNAVRTAANCVRYSLILEKGDLLILDNRRVVHARSEYHPRMNGYDRWLKRTLILQFDHWNSKTVNGVIG